ncbi:capsular polysaccharide biosynthesis protein CapK [Steroidobacter agaridevorans]|uniref:Capsular polysaccharide biosynthesis protein CapK n=1 Tax=Steroidobacter agaridevorans TaxID=2695856 RepID=A0A829YFW8_9GAMM|nr:phenylacetate--CoA ligase family protein [Steroidobacter agaridevorans]GFE82154.1 capsular polysaccharide biosynthesis protein CapK [Steroidobacter agaridevorans]
MLKRAEKLLYTLPTGLQNVALSLYGISLLRNRHGGNYKAYYEQAVARSRASRQELDGYENETLVRMLEHAVATVPYYRELHRQGQFPIEKVKGVADIQYLPTVPKAELRSNPEQFVSERYALEDLSVISTTGTTGTPLRIFCNANVRQRNYAFHDRFLTMCGIDKDGLRATIGGRIIVPSSDRNPPYWRHSYFQKNVLFSSYHLNDGTIGLYIEKLRALRPDYIDCYPSSIYSIASHAKKHGIPLRGITKAIVTSGETLFDDQKAVIEEQLGVTVFDQYGCAEMSVLVTSCAHGSYHVHSDFGILEILNSSGEPARDGEEGEIVCTGFINDAMPLIRYRIEDRAVAGQRHCPCGSALPTVARVLGRDDDVILTPGGDRIGRLSPVLKGFPVREAQYVQDKLGEMKVVLVPDAAYGPEDEAKLVRELRMRVGNEIRIEFQYVERIERGKGGKLKSIVSRIK